MRRAPLFLPVLSLFLFIAVACTQPLETLPAAPSDLTALPDGGTVILNWNYSGPAPAGYRVYRSETEAVTANDALLNGELLTALTFTDTDATVAEGGTYYYMVSAVDARGNVSPGSNIARATVPSPDLTPPDAPANLRATPGDGEVTLTWDAVGEPTLAGYRVYRSLTGEVDTSWELLTAELVTAGSYRDHGLTNGTTYYYMVVAVSKSGSVSAGSARVSATPRETPDEVPPAAPTGLTAEAGDAQVVLRWDDNSEPGLAGYHVYRSLTTAVDESVDPLNPLPLTTAEYTDAPMPNNVTYYYAVTAVDVSGNVSTPSDVVAATPRGAELELTPHELVFSTVRGEASEAQSLDILNAGTTSLEITGVSLSGPNADAFTLETPLTGPLNLAPGQRESVVLRFTPDDDDSHVGALSAALQVVSDEAGETSVGLYGLSAQGRYGVNEPTLHDVVTTLGYAIEVGGRELELGTGPEPIGDEVLAPLFERAGEGVVMLTAVARYSPDEPLPFGYYLPQGGDPLENQLATIIRDQSQTLYPALEEEITPTFDPGAEVFGVYVASRRHKTYTQDELNTGSRQVAHAVRVYPLRDRDGQPIPNSYLLAIEEAQNGDYQDYVFVLSNVRPAMMSSARR